jgi:DMSO/TMAO reductase YedYZ molybdopterin-dependent catalytic subunit
MIVVGMNGEQLPRAHGFPVRMIVPGLYGFISGTKWLTKLTLTTYADQQAYWTKKKWATDAPIKPSARIDTPRALATVSGDEIIVGGIAWAQNDKGVAKIQVQVDSGGWQDAELGPEVDSVYWRQWFYRWTDAKSGQSTIKARVVDGDGDVQTDVRAEPFPEGASGIHSIFVTVE